MAYIGKRPQDTFPSNNSVTATIISANAVGSSEIAGNAVGTGEIAANAVTAAKIPDNTITATHIPNGVIATIHLAADAVTGAKIADDAIDSEHFVDGSIDTAEIADVYVTTSCTASETCLPGLIVLKTTSPALPPYEVTNIAMNAGNAFLSSLSIVLRSIPRKLEYEKILFINPVLNRYFTPILGLSALVNIFRNSSLNLSADTDCIDLAFLFISLNVSSSITKLNLAAN